MRFSKAVVKCRIPILILALLLMIPSAVGMAKTRNNYDMLDYLPEDMDTVTANDLWEDFGKGRSRSLLLTECPTAMLTVFANESNRLNMLKPCFGIPPLRI